MSEQNEIDEATDNLHKAVANYIKVRGGSAWVTGAIQVIQFPDDLKYNWSLAVKVTGKMPEPIEQEPEISPSSK